jgi:hypothetical protein
VYRFARLVAALAQSGERSLLVSAEPCAHFHLLPIDRAIEAMLAVTDWDQALGVKPNIAHILPSRPIPIVELFNALGELLDIKIDTAAPAAFYSQQRSRAVRLADRKLRDVILYVRRRYEFRSRQVNAYSPCELNVNRALLDKTLMAYLQGLAPTEPTSVY